MLNWARSRPKLSDHRGPDPEGIAQRMPDAGGLRGGRVLVLARNYPNNIFPRLGLWTQRLAECATPFAAVKVIAPVPFAPPLPAIGPLAYYACYRQVHRRRWDGPVEVFHPRMLLGPGYSLHNAEALLYTLAVRPTVRRLRRRFPFDLIHAHFTYPDGVAACLLGREFGVPVVITEHSLWLPWMEQYPLVRRQATWAARACAVHLAVSDSLRQTIVRITGRPEKVRVVPNAVDGTVFRPAPGQQRRPGQILFVGTVRHVKGVDVLLRALPVVLRRCAGARLVLAGEPFYESYRRDAAGLDQLARDLGVADRVEIVGGKTPAEVAALMAESQVVVLPSRRETFGAVLIEAMASGAPVVATRCGGPEEVVTPAVGVLVPPEDPSALAEGLIDVLEHADRYDPQVLRDYTLRRYGVPAVSAQLRALYTSVLDRSRARLPRGA